jgi:hypothetical protein
MGPSRCRIGTGALALAVLSLAAALDAGAIVIRHDREDARYRAAAEKLPAPVDVGGAHGTLIDPRWVLTAAHVADGLSPFTGVVSVDGAEYPIRRVVLHPTWIGDLGIEPEWIDLALIGLARPVTGGRPVGLYEKRDEAGRIARFVGRGTTGDGNAGPTHEDRALRAATNRIEDVDEARIFFRFDAPPEATDLEGISGPGDSGGPALVALDDRLFVAGVSSWNDGGGQGECRYGSTEVYARVSTQLDWLRETMAERQGAGSVTELAKSGWPETLAGKLAAAFFEAYADGSPATLQAFAESSLASSARRTLPPAEWARLWAKQRERSGPAVPVRIASINQNKLFVLAVTADKWRSYRFELRGREPLGLLSLRSRPIRELHGEPLPDASRAFADLRAAEDASE